MCCVRNVIVLSLTSTPPPSVRVFALKNTSLNSEARVADAVAPSPLPPVISIDTTCSRSKLTGSTKISVNEPSTTGCTNAVVPEATDGLSTMILGELDAS